MTGHWDENWESTDCSARGSARRSQYVDFHLLRNLWDRGFRVLAYYAALYFASLRVGVVAIGRQMKPHGGCAGVYLLYISKCLPLRNELIRGRIVVEIRSGHASCHSKTPAPRPGSSLPRGGATRTATALPMAFCPSLEVAEAVL